MDPEKLDRSVTTTIASGTAAETESQNIRLKVQIEAARGAGFGGFFRLLMAIFSVVGVIVDLPVGGPGLATPRGPMAGPSR